MTDHLSPARPVSLGHAWRRTDIGLSPAIRAQIDATGETQAWQWGFIRVLSSREWVEYRGAPCWTNHVSVSVVEQIGHRPSDEVMEFVRHDFDMHDAEEDNHQPGRIRNLFLPLHLPRGTVGICDCKSDETLVVEPDGFMWSRPKADAS